jgi:hypothetical protein
MFRARTTLGALAAMAFLGGCGSSPDSPHFPASAAGRQARWLTRALSRVPLSTAVLAAHFDQGYLGSIVSPAATTVNATLSGLSVGRVGMIASSQPETVSFELTTRKQSRLSVDLTVDAEGLISELNVRPVDGSTPAGLVPLTAAASQHLTTGVREYSVGVGQPPLKGTLTVPGGKGPFPAVVLVSGAGANDQNDTIGVNNPFQGLAAGLAARGVATLRYDKRSLDYPRSINRWTYTPATEYVPDAVAAVKLLRTQPSVDPRRIFILGHSQAGAYAPLIAQQDPEVAGLILVAPQIETTGASLVHVVRYEARLPGGVGRQARAGLTAARRIAAQIDSAARLRALSSHTLLYGAVGPAYWLDALRYNALAAARAIHQPLLILEGERDYEVSLAADLRRWRRGLSRRPRVTIKRLRASDHYLLDLAGRPTPLDYEHGAEIDPEAITTIASWIDRVARG